MERLKTQNLHFKRILDRQLSEIETKQRQNEAKRQREVRSLGIDLTKLQKSTRDLDEIFSTSPIIDTPRAKPRSASFSEFSHSPRPLTSPALTPGRRNSVTSTNLLSRSRQELTGLSPTSLSPKSPSQTVFDFKLNPNKRSTLPEIIYISNHSSNNNNNNSRKHHHINDNNGNRIRSSSVTRNSSSDISLGIDNANTVITKLTLSSSTNSNQNNIDNHNINHIRHRRNSLDNSSFPSGPIQVSSNKNNSTVSNMTREGERRKSTSSLKSVTSSSPSSSLSPSLSSSSPPTKSQAHSQPRRGSKSGPVINAGINDVTPQIVKDRTSPVRTGRRGSSDDSSHSSSPPKGKKTLDNIKTTPDLSHNKTVVICVHRDDDEPLVLSPEPSSEGSMFASRPRRSSEPAIGGHLLRTLQNTIPEERMSSSHSPLRKSIAEGLPSGIVAEEDEDRYNEEVEDEKRKENENNDEDDSTTITKPIERPQSCRAADKETQQNKAKDKTSPIEPNKDTSVITKRQQQSLSSSDVSASSPSSSTPMPKKNSRNKDGKTTTNEKKAEGENKKSQARRKSDGDVSLRFARIWRLQAGNKASMRELFKEKKEEAPPPPPDTKDAVWDAVRKCRYIRGYDPPSMGEQSDVSEFVFGSETNDPSLVAE